MTGESAGRRVVLLFPGQGSQHERMAAGLYHTEPVYRATLDEMLTVMERTEPALRSDLFAERPVVAIDHVARAQPLLFAIDYALGRLVLSWGIRPAALLGHSIGELAAAALAEIFSPSDAAELVMDRVRRLRDAPPGAMLAVAATVDEVTPFLTADVVVGAVNAPRQIVLSGPEYPLEAAGAALRAAGYVVVRVPSLTAFHSPSLAPAVAGARRAFAQVPVGSPRMTVYSGYTAEPLSPAQCADPGYWAGQSVAPVLFYPALDAVLQAGDAVLVEAGPSQGLSQVARRHPAVRRGTSSVLSLLPARLGRVEDDVRCLRHARQALDRAGWRG
jgi:acyl transferase domain-containing protein